MQKGAAQIFLIALAAIVILTGVFYFYQTLNKDDLQISPQANSPTETINTHTDQDLGFKLSYPSEMILKTDTEEEFNQRGNGDFRKNFTYYVTYPPAKVLETLSVLDETGSFDKNPFTVWVFDNPDNLTIDRWYKDYWYYPFVWGDYTYTGKFTLAPKDEATISGQMAKSGIIDYAAGKPKFVYLSKEKKMYLFRIIGEDGDKILKSFKFTN